MSNGLLVLLISCLYSSYIPGAKASPTTVVGIGQPCFYDSQCGRGSECVAGVCGYRCETTEDCGEVGKLECRYKQCVRSCQGQSECASHQICEDNVCTVRCQDTDGCPCTALRNSICYNNACVRRCSKVDDCPQGNQCIEGVCRDKSACVGDASCPYNTSCIGGRCVGVCDSNNKCPSTHFCNQATRICQTLLGAQCPAVGCGCGQKCVGGVCEMMEQIDSPCSSGAYCGENAVCNDTVSGVCECIRNNEGHCLPAPTPCDPTYDQCGFREPRTKCSSDTNVCDCEAGSIISGKCYKGDDEVCHPETQQCAEGDNQCRSGHCYPACSTGSPCPDGLACHDGVCTIHCHHHSDCGGTQFCVNGRCVQTCMSGGLCDTQQKCDTHMCRQPCSPTDSTCGIGSACQPGIGCVATCTRDEHCLSNLELCVSGLCKPKCKSNADCDSISTCLNGRCYTVCSDEDDYCTDQQYCTYGLCMARCKDTADCGPTEVCPVYRTNPVCRLQCYANDDCYRQKQICFTGLCSSPCKAHKDKSCDYGDDCLTEEGIWACASTCSSGCNEVQYCSTNNYCKAKYGMTCTSRLDCDPYNYCKKEGTATQGTCTPSIKVGGSCKTVSCGMNEVCADGVCECVKYNDGTCLGPPNYCPTGPTAEWISCGVDVAGSSCNNRTDMCQCPDSHQQVVRQCLNLRECTKDDDCPGASCVAFRCHPRCTKLSQCPQGLACANGLCSLNCTAHSECEYGQVCVGGKCLISCSADDTQSCTIEQGCDSLSGVCRRTCTDDSQCADTKDEAGYCKNGLCVALCTNASECGARHRCSEAGVCQPLCNSEKDCAPTDYCIAGVCSAHCSKNSDCLGSFNCKLGICSPPCSSDSDCLTDGSRCHVGSCVSLCLPGVNHVCGSAACAAGVCTALCNTDEVCSPNEAKCHPLEGGCYIECRKDEHCSAGQYCKDSKFCESSQDRDCSSDAGVCGAEFYCSEGVCTALHNPGKSCRPSQSGDSCGPLEYCSSALQCECIRDSSGSCLTSSTDCTDDAFCKTKMGPSALCDPALSICVCDSKLARLNNAGKCVQHIKGCDSSVDCGSSGEVCYDHGCHTTCNSDTNSCRGDTVCKNGVCLQACNKDSECWSNSQSCIQGACISLCSQSNLADSACVEGIVTSPCGECDSGWVCYNGFCVITCARDSSCAANQACVGGKCLCNQTTHQCPGPSHTSGMSFSCTSDEDCGSLAECSLSKSCQCQMGAIRSSSGECVWNLDVVCQSCPTCIGSCDRENMVCNTKSRLCVCIDGYVLDPSTLSCTKLSGALTNFRCQHQVDCTAYPGTVCSSSIGRCVCKPGFCYQDGDCYPDINECDELLEPCSVKSTCVNVPCRTTPICENKKRLIGVTTIGLGNPGMSCSTADDCKTYYLRDKSCNNRKCGFVSCFHGKCTCERGTLVSAGSGKACHVHTCSKAIECDTRETCSAMGTCVLNYKVPESAAAVDVQKVSQVVGASVGILIGLLVVLAITFLAYKKFSPTKAEKQRKFWEKEEARLIAEEAELDRMEREFEEEQRRKREEYEQRVKEQKERQARERAERAEMERLKREEEERLLREQAEREEEERKRRLQEEKEAKEREKKLAKEARLKAEAERKAKAAAEKKRREEEAEAERLRIEEERRQRAEEERAKRQAEKEAREAMRLAQIEEERRLKEEQEAKKLALKKQQEAARLAREKAIKDKERAQRERIEAIKRQTALELQRLQDEKNKRLASMAALNTADSDDDVDVAQSGWSTAPTVSKPSKTGSGSKISKSKSKA